MTKSLERPARARRRRRRAPRARDHLRRAVLSRSSAAVPPVRAPLAAPPPRRPPRDATATRSPTTATYVEWLVEAVDARATPTSSPRSSPARAACGRTRTPTRTRAPRVERASVWFTAYPLSLITRPGESFLAALGDEALWEAFAAIGIDAVHTGPVKRAGGLSGWEPTPERRRPLRPDQHADRPGVRHRGRVPRACARSPPGTAARSSTTSCPATPARAPTSGSPR